MLKESSIRAVTKISKEEKGPQENQGLLGQSPGSNQARQTGTLNVGSGREANKVRRSDLFATQGGNRCMGETPALQRDPRVGGSGR